MHPALWSDMQLWQACTHQALAARGPGGQHANRASTACRLQWPGPPALSVLADEHRSGDENRRAALARLRLELACTLRGQSEPSWLLPHRQGTRLSLSAQARDIHAVAAVLLDALSAAAGNPAAAARALELSTSTLVKALAVHDRLWQAAQALCAELGAPPLRRP